MGAFVVLAFTVWKPSLAKCAHITVLRVIRAKLGTGIRLLTGKMGLDFLGLGFGNEKVNWDLDCLKHQYWEFLYLTK